MHRCFENIKISLVLKTHSQNLYFLRSKTHLKKMCSNVFKNKFHQFLIFFLLNININKILFNFEKEWCTFDKKKRMFEEKKNCSQFFENAKELSKHQQFVSNFEHSNSTSNGT